MLTYVEGDAGSLQFPQALQQEDGSRALGRFVREFHDAVAGFVPAFDAEYRIGVRPLGVNEIVCHGDLGYWSTIWRGDEVVALIDWDCAEPDTPLRDVAFAAMTTVPMHADESAERSGFLLPLDRRVRLRAFCPGCGDIEPADVVQAAANSLTLEIERLRVFGAEGREPWASFVERGQGRMFETVAAWIAENRDSLV